MKMTENFSESGLAEKQKRPLLLWMLSLILVAAGFTSLLQAFRAMQSWNLLVAIGYRFGPLYPVFQGLLLAGIFFVGAALLLARIHWAPSYNIAGVIAAAVWFWLDRLVFNLNPQPLVDQIFSLVFFIILLGLVLAGLWSIGPNMNSPKTVHEESQDSSFMGGTNEQE